MHAHIEIIDNVFRLYLSINENPVNSPSALSSPPSVYSMNTDGNIQLYGSTMSSPMSGNMSPLSPVSSSDSSSAYNIQHLHISSNTNGNRFHPQVMNFAFNLFIF